MRKIDRLRWIERAYGPEFVLPYRACYTPDDLRAAFNSFPLGTPLSVRTDWADAPDQGYGLPFLYNNADVSKVLAVWDRWGPKLVYIVCASITPEENFANVAAEQIGPTRFLVEWDDGDCAQRAWEHACMPLYHAFVETADDTDFGSYDEVPGRGVVRFVRPRSLPARTAFERMFLRILTAPDAVDPLTVYTVARDGRIVVW